MQLDQAGIDRALALQRLDLLEAGRRRSRRGLHRRDHAAVDVDATVGDDRQVLVHRHDVAREHEPRSDVRIDRILASHLPPSPDADGAMRTTRVDGEVNESIINRAEPGSFYRYLACIRRRPRTILSIGRTVRPTLVVRCSDRL